MKPHLLLANQHRSAKTEAKRQQVLRLLAMRKGGTTTAEVANILDIKRGTAKIWLAALVTSGHVVRHGNIRTQVTRCTLKDDPLTRPLAPLSPKTKPDRARLVPKAVVGRKAFTTAFLAKKLAIGRSTARKLIRTMLDTGVLVRIGVDSDPGTRYRLVDRVVVGV